MDKDRVVTHALTPVRGDPLLRECNGCSPSLITGDPFFWECNGCPSSLWA